jgi:Tetracyclin repressor-like, C-terminal domain
LKNRRELLLCELTSQRRRSRLEEFQVAILDATWDFLKTTSLRDLSIEAITQQMTLLVKAFSGKYGRIVAQIIAEGHACPQVLTSYRDRFLYPRREAAKVIIQETVENGEFDPTLDPKLAINIL